MLLQQQLYQGPLVRYLYLLQKKKEKVGIPTICLAIYLLIGNFSVHMEPHSFSPPFTIAMLLQQYVEQYQCFLIFQVSLSCFLWQSFSKALVNLCQWPHYKSLCWVTWCTTKNKIIYISRTTPLTTLCRVFSEKCALMSHWTRGIVNYYL